MSLKGTNPIFGIHIGPLAFRQYVIFVYNNFDVIFAVFIYLFTPLFPDSYYVYVSILCLYLTHPWVVHLI